MEDQEYGSWVQAQMGAELEIRSHYREFKEKGIAYTEGFVEGRKGRLSNLFNLRVIAAKRVLEDMTKDSQ